MALPDNHANEQASASALIPTPTSAPIGAPTAPTTAARAQFEAERISRRAALRKFGFGAGMAALLALSSDDLARMAAAKLKQQAGDNKVANQVAGELKNAGVAFADFDITPIDDDMFREPCYKPYRPLDCTSCTEKGTTACMTCAKPPPTPTLYPEVQRVEVVVLAPVVMPAWQPATVLAVKPKNLCKNRFIVHVLCSFLTVHRIELTSIHAWLLAVVCS